MPLFSLSPGFGAGHPAPSPARTIVCSPLSLFESVRDSTSREVVRRKIHQNAVSRQDPYEVLAYLAGNIRKHFVAVW